MRRARTELTLTEWVVLALIAEGPTHGWAVVRAMRPDGPLGVVWSSRAPLVYRAIRILMNADLVRAVGSADGRGPSRTVLEATPAGHEAVGEWLAEPVAHVRDLRSELLAKLLLLERRGLDPDRLIGRQREHLETLAMRLDSQLADAGDGSQRLVTLWRSTTTRAAFRFLEAFGGADSSAEPPGIRGPDSAAGA
ncbi:MAG TPA: PadR family transcriptional regulator [Patescibacteria group bacterium]|nr:PadR family transcriptional regulator [Patescibacteria group bacterium]